MGIFAEAGSKKDNGGLFTQAGEAPSAGIFSQGGSVARGTQPTEQSVAGQEAQLAQAGGTKYDRSLLGWLLRLAATPASQTVGDVLQRTAYAGAGAAEAAFNPSPEEFAAAPLGPATRAIRRAGKELFSGVGGLKGEKRGYGEVAERAGVPPGPTLNTLIALAAGHGHGLPSPEQMARLETLARPLLGAATGQGVGAGEAVSKFLNVPEVAHALSSEGLIGGATSRGLGGTILDIGLAPETYLTFGAGTLGQVAEKGGIKALSRLGGKAVLREMEEALPTAARAAIMKGATLSEATLPEAGKAAFGAVAGRQAENLMRQTFTEGGESLARSLELQRGVLAAAEASPTFQDAVAHEAGTILGEGLKSGPIYDQVTREVYEQARRKVLVAAEKNPALLDQGGFKWMGIPIKPVNQGIALAGRASAKALDALAPIKSFPIVSSILEKGSEAYDGLGRLLLSRDWQLGKGPPGEREFAQLMKQAHLDAEQYVMTKHLEDFRQAVGPQAEKWYAGLTKDGRDKLTKEAIKLTEAGKAADIPNPYMRQIIAAMRQSFDRQALESAEFGTGHGLVPNYIARYYENKPKDLERIFSELNLAAYSPFSRRPVALNGLGRNGEERAFETLDEAEKFAKWAKAKNPSLPDLEPLTDAREIMLRRTRTHARDAAWTSYYKTMAEHFGMPIEGAFDPQKVFDLVQPADLHLSPSEKWTTSYQAWKKNASPETVARLSDDAKREFFRLKYSGLTSEEHLRNMVDKYRDLLDYAPQRLPQAGEVVNGVEWATVPGIQQLQGIKVPKYIAEDIERMGQRQLADPELAGFIKGFVRPVNNFFKTSVTLPFPSFSFRNMYNNAMQSFLDVGVSAFDPRLAYDTVRLMNKEPGVLVTKFGARYGLQELRDLGLRYGVEATPEQLVEMVPGRLGKTQLLSALRKPNAVIENEARWQLFLNHVRRGEDPILAASNMKRVLFDYANLTDFERRYLRESIPFYTWTRKNITYQLQELKRHPGRVAAELKAFSGREGEDREMTSWEGNAFKVRLNRDGKTLTVLTGIDLPIKSLDNIWSPVSMETWRRNFGSLTPFLKVPTEMLFGKQAFTNREFGRIRNDSAAAVIREMPKGIQNWLGFDGTKDAAGRPKNTFDEEKFYALFQSFAISRLVSSSERQWRTISEGKGGGAALLDFVTGLRVKDLNLTEEQQKRLRERERQLQEDAYRRGLLKHFERYYQ